MLKKPLIHYVGTTKTPVVNYEIYLDSFRIGFVRMRSVNGKDSWFALQWVGKHVGKFTDQNKAVKAVVKNYTLFREHSTKTKIKIFEQHAIRRSIRPNLKPEEAVKTRVAVPNQREKQ